MIEMVFNLHKVCAIFIKHCDSILFEYIYEQHGVW
jgi:hypothetical protein